MYVTGLEEKCLKKDIGEEIVFFRNDKFLFTYCSCNSSLFCLPSIQFYEIEYIKTCKDFDFNYLLNLPIKNLDNIVFEKSILKMDRLYDISCYVTKKYRLRVITSSSKFELQLEPKQTKLYKIYNVKSNATVQNLANTFEEDEFMLKYTQTQVEMQKDNQVILIDYNTDFICDYLFEIGTRLDNINKPILFRYNNLDLSLYDEIMFGNVGSELSVVDMSTVKVDMHYDIQEHMCSENTIFNKGVWLLKKGNENIELFMESSSIYFTVNSYQVDNFPDEVQNFIKQYIKLDKKNICNFFVKSVLMKPDILDFIRTHNGIWYI